MQGGGGRWWEGSPGAETGSEPPALAGPRWGHPALWLLPACSPGRRRQRQAARPAGPCPPSTVPQSVLAWISAHPCDWGKNLSEGAPNPSRGARGPVGGRWRGALFSLRCPPPSHQGSCLLLLPLSGKLVPFSSSRSLRVLLPLGSRIAVGGACRALTVAKWVFTCPPRRPWTCASARAAAQVCPDHSGLTHRRCSVNRC